MASSQRPSRPVGQLKRSNEHRQTPTQSIYRKEKRKSKEVKKRKIKMKHLQGHKGTTPDESMDVTERNPNQNQ
jgi:hypothetical protein